jgi:hypothetical protein
LLPDFRILIPYEKFFDVDYFGFIKFKISAGQQQKASRPAATVAVCELLHVFPLSTACVF